MTSQPATITVTEDRLAALFEEWLRRYNEEPEAYEDEYGEPESYGAGAAAYLVKLDGEVAR